MGTPDGVANVFVLTREFFSYERGISFAEAEFPIYYNFFLLKKRIKIVCTPKQKGRLERFMQESLFGPENIDLRSEIRGNREECPWYPDLGREANHFRRHPFDPTRPMVLEDLVEYVLFDGKESSVEVDGLEIHRARDGSFELYDRAVSKKPVRIDGGLSLPPRIPERATRRSVFKPPVFGVTTLGSGHGFDAKGKTTGLLLWINRRGIMVDPPVDSTDWLQEREVPSRLVDSIILTHVHADHDGGTLQKILQADRIRLYSTPTIFHSFLRKAEAITGLPKERFLQVVQFHPVPIRRPVRINGARFLFNYNLHSIPTIRLEVSLGGRSFLYSSDTLNVPGQIKKLQEQGVLSQGRAEDLLDYPWEDHDVIIHEAGIPPLHTPPVELAKLPKRIKNKLYLVHTTKEALPKDSGLRMAPQGLSGTIRIPVKVGSNVHREAVEWLHAMRAVEHFRNLPVHKAIEFLQIVSPKTFKAGETVMKLGEEGHYFYMILLGKAAINKGEVAKKVYGMYEYFGEASLILDIPRTADVVAISELKVLRMEKSDFLNFIQGTDIFEQMARLFVNRGLKSWSLMDQHPVLNFLNAAQRTELQSFMDLVHFAPGEEIQSQGDEKSRGFLISSGKVEEKVDGEHVASWKKGDLVADILSIAESKPAPHTLVAANNVKAYVFGHDSFRRFLLSYPGAYLRLLHVRRG
jgi:CRP-like cAMP-binding protein